jgi:hypothetical protein
VVAGARLRVAMTLASFPGRIVKDSCDMHELLLSMSSGEKQLIEMGGIDVA